MRRILAALLICGALAPLTIVAETPDPAPKDSPKPPVEKPKEEPKKDPADTTSLHAEKKGLTITIKPNGPQLEIPQGWENWYTDPKLTKNLYLTREEIDGTKDGGGEWDTEYAEVANSVFGIDKCGFRGGGEAFGDKAVAFSDLQMAVYIVSDKIEDIEKRLDEDGAKAVKTILSPEREAKRNIGDKGLVRKVSEKEIKDHEAKPVKDFAPARDKVGEWNRSKFSYELHYGDYGGTATVDVRLQRFGGRTVAVVLFYTNFQAQSKTIDAILDSVKWEKPPAEEEPKKDK